MTLNDELNLVKDFKNTSKFINEPCVLIVKIISYETSESKKDYKGNPFIEFDLEDEDGRRNTVTFYRITGKETDKAREFKIKRLKEFLANAEYDESLEGEEAIKSVVGKKVKALFKKVEYIGKDKDNFNKPIIKEVIEYSFCAKVNDTIKGNQSYFHTPLKPIKLEQFKERLAEWEAEHKPTKSKEKDEGLSAPKTDSIEDENGDDLPF